MAKNNTGEIHLYINLRNSIFEIYKYLRIYHEGEAGADRQIKKLTKYHIKKAKHYERSFDNQTRRLLKKSREAQICKK